MFYCFNWQQLHFKHTLLYSADIDKIAPKTQIVTKMNQGQTHLPTKTKIKFRKITEQKICNTRNSPFCIKFRNAANSMLILTILRCFPISL